jgi:hypothetical protein
MNKDFKLQYSLFIIPHSIFYSEFCLLASLMLHFYFYFFLRYTSAGIPIFRISSLFFKMTLMA